MGAISKVALILFIFLAVVIAFYFSIIKGLEKEGCNALVSRVKDRINQSNYCSMDSDCIMVEEFNCPFGCYNLVNKGADLTEIREGVKKYGRNCPLCEYDCSIPPDAGEIRCVQGKCADTGFSG